MSNATKPLHKQNVVLNAIIYTATVLSFFVFITPLALVLRLLGRDELRLKRWQQDTYWCRVKTRAQGMTFFQSQK